MTDRIAHVTGPGPTTITIHDHPDHPYGCAQCGDGPATTSAGYDQRGACLACAWRNGWLPDTIAWHYPDTDPHNQRRELVHVLPDIPDGLALVRGVFDLTRTPYRVDRAQLYRPDLTPHKETTR